MRFWRRACVQQLLPASLMRPSSRKQKNACIPSLLTTTVDARAKLRHGRRNGLPWRKRAVFPVGTVHQRLAPRARCGWQTKQCCGRTRRAPMDVVRFCKINQAVHRATRFSGSRVAIASRAIQSIAVDTKVCGRALITF